MATPYKLDFPDVTDPNFDPDVPFEADNGINYKWNGNAWEVVCGAGTDTDGFLLKHGHIIDDAPDPVKYQWNEPVTIETELTTTREGIKLKSPDSYINVGTIDGDEGQIDLYAADILDLYGSQAKLRGSTVNVDASFGDVTLQAPNGAEKVERNISINDPDKQITNKEYVENRVSFLQSEVVELEEEIEALAITSERGEWISATSVNAGEFRMVNLLGSNTQDYNDETIVSVIFNNFDANDPSVEHGWADVEVGNILELLDKPDSDYAIFEITGKNPGTGVMAFDVAFVKGTGEATLGDRTRIKIFAKPTGGNLEDYVRIAGDDMTGRLRMDTQDAEFEKDYRPPTDGNRAFIQLKNVAGTGTRLASVWQPQATDEVALGRSVHIESIIHCNAYYGYVLSDAADGSGRRERTTQDPNIQFFSFNGDDRGRIKWGSDDRINWTEAGGSLFSDNGQAKLSWDSDRVEIKKPVGHDVSATGFKIRGTRPFLPGDPDVFDNNGEIFRVKHVNNEADYIEYLGQIKDYSLVTKKYVDDAVSNSNSSALIDVRTNNPSSPAIGYMWYNKSTNQLLLRIS